MSTPGEAGAAKWDTNATIGCLIFLAIVIGVVWFVVVLIRGGGDETPNVPGNRDSSVGAWIACQQRMDANLKAPASAGYPLVSELEVEQAGTTYTFPLAWVDAENSFGAQIRTFFTCTAIEQTNSWSVRVTVLE